MSDDEDDLFRRAMSGAKPIKTEKRVPPAGKKPRPKAKFARADESAALEESLDEDFDEFDTGSS